MTLNQTSARVSKRFILKSGFATEATIAFFLILDRSANPVMETGEQHSQSMTILSCAGPGTAFHTRLTSRKGEFCALACRRSSRLAYGMEHSLCGCAESTAGNELG
jgi:hypothetical protein